MQYAEFVLKILSLGMLVFSIIFTLGIIWRAEMKLDTVYKIFFVALVFLFISQGMELFVKNEIFSFVGQIFNSLFFLVMLASIWMTRDLFKKIDEEKKKSSN
ncbi:MAG TPA: hypothetical protein P5548_03365 [Candidatus Moranbacteria bacterium]|nr:hypothetical protein [Candidatus Moranbacteria bacterium]HRZ33909.1 hypothetical protein [Candidatus Moranbacteria bacterium]